MRSIRLFIEIAISADDCLIDCLNKRLFIQIQDEDDDDDDGDTDKYNLFDEDEDVDVNKDAAKPSEQSAGESSGSKEGKGSTESDESSKKILSSEKPVPRKRYPGTRFVTEARNRCIIIFFYRAAFNL